MKILIVGPSWVGDLIISQTLYRQLKAQGVDQIDMLVPKWCAGIVGAMPEIDQCFEMPIGHGRFDLLGRYRLGRQLKKQGYDQAYVMPNSWKSALIPFFAGIPKRTGWLGECRYGLLNDACRLNKKALPLMVQRYAALAQPKSSRHQVAAYLPPKLVLSPERVAQTTQALQLNWEKPVLALAPGAAFGNAKRWPENHYAAVANHFLDQGWAVWVMGSPDDMPVLAKIAAQTQGRARVLGGDVTLDQKVDCLSGVQAVVSNDSGLMHVSAALDRPVVVVYGSTTADFTPPLGKQCRTVFRTDLSCRPCFRRNCPLTGVELLQCLEGIPPSRVIDALTAVLGAES